MFINVLKYKFGHQHSDWAASHPDFYTLGSESLIYCIRVQFINFLLSKAVKKR